MNFAQFQKLPAYLRWPILAFVGILVLSVVQSFTDQQLLTSTTTIQTALKWAMPILIAGLGGLFAERCGVVNIGLEGMMILGTWCGAWGALHFGSPWWGLVSGIVGGALGGLLHAIATVAFSVDHIVSGVAINILAPGTARYLSERVFTQMDGGSISQSPRVESLGDFTWPILAKGPDLLGKVERLDWFLISDIFGVLRGLLFQMTYLTAIGLALVPISAFLLNKTKFGLRLRIAGEKPLAGESLGINIYKQKFLGVIISGGLAGLAGSFIVLELAGLYRQNQTTGRGFIALAALIFGNWKARGVLTGAVLFGYPFGLSLRDLEGTATRSLLLVIAIALVAVVFWALSEKNKADAILAGVVAAGSLLFFFGTDTAPKWLPGTMPYVLVLLVLVFASQRLRMPAAVGLPYRKGGS